MGPGQGGDAGEMGRQGGCGLTPHSGLALRTGPRESQLLVLLHLFVVANNSPIPICFWLLGQMVAQPVSIWAKPALQSRDQAQVCSGSWHSPGTVPVPMGMGLSLGWGLKTGSVQLRGKKAFKEPLETTVALQGLEKPYVPRGCVALHGPGGTGADVWCRSRARRGYTRVPRVP